MPIPSFSLLSSLCSLPSSRAAAHFSDRSSHWSLRTFSSLFALLLIVVILHASIPRVESLTRLMISFLLCLLSSLFNLLSSLCSLLSSLAAPHCSGHSSHLSLRTLHQTIEPAPSSLDPVRHHPALAIIPPNAAQFRYCPPEGRSVSLLSLQRPLGFTTVPPEGRSVSRLSPRRPMVTHDDERTIWSK